jgi:CubicO group peptidase (beta-lactamase class C family)
LWFYRDTLADWIVYRHLLTHTVGLSYDTGDADLIKWAAATGRTVTNQDWCLEGFTTPFSFPPGEGWCYGTAIDWAGYVLEVVTGQKLGEYMEQHIFKPLGMASTTFFPKRIPGAEDRIVEYFERDENGILKPFTFEGNVDNHQMDSGGGGLISTPGDYAKLLLAILQHKLINQETTETMFTPQLDEVQAASVQEYVELAPHVFVPEFPLKDGHVAITLNHGLGGMMNMEDVPGKRKKGSLTWSGYTNGRWFIDRETGISALLFTQVFPFADPVVINLWDELEKVVYSDFLPVIRSSA